MLKNGEKDLQTDQMCKYQEYSRGNIMHVDDKNLYFFFLFSLILS